MENLSHTSFANKLRHDYDNDYHSDDNWLFHAYRLNYGRWNIRWDAHCYIYILTAKAVQLIGTIKIQSRMVRDRMNKIAL